MLQARKEFTVVMDPRVTITEEALQLPTDLSMACYKGYHEQTKEQTLHNVSQICLFVCLNLSLSWYVNNVCCTQWVAGL